MNKKQVLRKYKNLPLAVAIYQKNLDYSVPEFSKPEDLIYILYEIYSGDADITKDGVRFIKEYYGIEEVMRMVKIAGGELALKTDKEILKFLKALDLNAIYGRTGGPKTPNLSSGSI